MWHSSCNLVWLLLATETLTGYFELADPAHNVISYNIILYNAISCTFYHIVNIDEALTTLQWTIYCRQNFMPQLFMHILHCH